MSVDRVVVVWASLAWVLALSCGRRGGDSGFDPEQECSSSHGASCDIKVDDWECNDDGCSCACNEGGARWAWDCVTPDCDLSDDYNDPNRDEDALDGPVDREPPKSGCRGD